MRRSNGTGTIVKLSGTRRKPYAVRIAGRNKYGDIIQVALGYYSTIKEAQSELDQYNKDKTAGVAPEASKLTYTVENIYNLWSERKYQKSGSSSIRSYKASWSRLSSIGTMKMRDVSIDHLQRIIDQSEACGLSKSSIANDKLLMNAICKFAMERDIIQKDYSAFVELPHVDPKHEKGSFTGEQIKKLEGMALSGVPWADTVLMLCYTGFRITEFLTLTSDSYDRDGDFFRAGIKTEAGKNRIVPVHPRVKPHLIRFLGKGGKTIICNDDKTKVGQAEYRKLFVAISSELGVPQATPHWCRHTFATLLHEYGAPELGRKRLLGHSNKDVTEHYTHTDLDQLRAAMLLIE